MDIREKEEIISKVTTLLKEIPSSRDVVRKGKNEDRRYRYLARHMVEKAIEKATPIVEVKSRRIGGATYQVPIEVATHRRFYLASHWIINAATGRKGKPMADKLALELIAAANEEGGAIKKKDDTHRMAEANKAFAHFRR